MKTFIQKLLSFIAGIFRGADTIESVKRVIAFLFSLSLIVLLFLAVHFEVKSTAIVTLVSWFMFTSIWVLLGLAAAQDIIALIKGKFGSTEPKQE